MLHCVPHFLMVPNPRCYIPTLCKRADKCGINTIIVKEFKSDESQQKFLKKNFVKGWHIPSDKTLRAGTYQWVFNGYRNVELLERYKVELAEYKIALKKQNSV